jgi:hypothetical protein
MLAHDGLQVPLLSHLYGEQSFEPAGPIVVWSPSHVAEETHFLVAGSQVVGDAHSESCVHEAAHEAVLPSQR